MPAGHYVAGGNIAPSRFVMGEAGTAKTVVQATANAKVMGISQEGGRQAPLNDLVTTIYAAIDGDSLKVYGDSDTDVLLEVGTAGVTAFDNLTSDGNGMARTSVAGENTGAVGANRHREELAVTQTVTRFWFRFSLAKR